MQFVAISLVLSIFHLMAGSLDYGVKMEMHSHTARPSAGNLHMSVSNKIHFTGARFCNIYIYFFT